MFLESRSGKTYIPVDKLKLLLECIRYCIITSGSERELIDLYFMLFDVYRQEKNLEDEEMNKLLWNLWHLD